MRTTSKNVIFHTTHRVNGLLEQGGVMGRVAAYPLDAACRVTGLTAAQLAAANENDNCPGIMASLRDVIENRVQGRVIRRGVDIQ